MTVRLDDLRRGGFLSPLDEHSARTIARIGGEDRPEIELAAALVSRQVERGHVCFYVSRPPPLVDEDGSSIDEGSWPEAGLWLEAIRSSPLVGDGTVTTPFVLDSAGRLYFFRYWRYQQKLAEALRERAREIDSPPDARTLREGLDRLFGKPATEGLAQGELFSPTETGPDWQRIATLAALRRRFTVISGGPGTGKTFTVVKILALLVEQALCARERSPRVTLLAPTGKAAARLTESIRRAKAGLHCADEVKRQIPEAASTIHRCLGWAGEGGGRFRHNRRNPLFTDLVLVDEASMVDLALMVHLVDALAPRTRLILLGDKDQLASVEAGAVLGDICDTGRPRTYSVSHTEEIRTLSGELLPIAAGAPQETGILDSIVELTTSYRYDAASGIGRLARAINAGNAEEALAVLDAEDRPDVVLAEPAGKGELAPPLLADIVDGFRHYLREPDPEKRLRAFDRFRVLCAHRRGPYGVETVNRTIEGLLQEEGLADARDGMYLGRPILVTRNDYTLNLYNGDVGLIVEDRPGGDGRLALFLGAGDALRRLSPSRLPLHETAFAMSIHKSQGSEFDEVVVLLPDPISPLVTRELLYTAVTRARKKVVLHARREVLRQGIERRIERASGLRELLWESGDGLQRREAGEAARAGQSRGTSRPRR